METVFHAPTLVIVIVLSSVRIAQGCRNEGLRVGLQPAAEEEEQVQPQQPCAKESLHNRFVTLHLAPLCLSGGWEAARGLVQISYLMNKKFVDTRGEGAHKYS